MYLVAHRATERGIRQRQTLPQMDEPALIAPSPVKQIEYRYRSMPEIARAVADEHGVDLDDMRGESKRDHIFEARREAIARIYAERPNITCAQIAAFFGRSRSTVQHMLSGRPPRQAPNRSAAEEHFRRNGLAELQSNGMPRWARDLVDEVAARTGVNVSEIAGAARFRKVVDARNEAMYAIRAAKPATSLPQIGKWFGRDHTSILHAIANHQKRNGLPKLVGYDLDRARARNADTSARMRAAA